jgi:hypothetical protein
MVVLKVKQIFMVINLWVNGNLMIYSKLLQVQQILVHIQEVVIVHLVNHHGEIIRLIML